MSKPKRRLFVQALLISLLFNIIAVLAMANYSGAVHPLAPQRGVQELENIEVIKPPPKVIQVPEIKPPPRVVQAAPEITEDTDAIDTWRQSIGGFVPLDPDLENPWIGIKPTIDPDGQDKPYVPPKVIHAPEPDYPPFLKEAGWSGSCTVGVHLDEKGDILKVWIIRSSDKDEADLAALSAARASQWEPASDGGLAIPKSISVTYEFEVDVY